MVKEWVDMVVAFVFFGAICFTSWTLVEVAKIVIPWVANLW